MISHLLVIVVIVRTVAIGHIAVIVRRLVAIPIVHLLTVRHHGVTSRHFIILLLKLLHRQHHSIIRHLHQGQVQQARLLHLKRSQVIPTGLRKL